MSTKKAAEGKGSRTEPSPKSSRAGKTEAVESAEKPAKSGKVVKAEKVEKAETKGQSGKASKGSKPAKAESVETPTTTEKTGKSGKIGKLSKPSSQPVEVDEPDLIDENGEVAGQLPVPASSRKAGKIAKNEPPPPAARTGKPGSGGRNDPERPRPLRVPPAGDRGDRGDRGRRPEPRRAPPRDEPRNPKLGKIRPITPPAPPPPPPPPPKSLEDRIAEVVVRLEAQTEDFRRLYRDRFDMSWIFHDSALEGTSYSPEELRSAIETTAQLPPDSSLQQVVDEIRRNREAIEFCRDLATKKRLPITVDTVKQIYWKLHPEDPDFRQVKFRKDIPQHRLYFHEYTAPDKIQVRVRAIVDWLNDPETRKVRNGVRIAARVHYDLLRVFPFAEDSGKVARMLMNVLLMRAGYPPAIIHHTERQRYYEALKNSPAIILSMVQEAIDNAVASIEKLLDEHEAKKRGYQVV